LYLITASPSEDWRRPPGRSRTTWMKTIQQDLRSNNLSLDDGSESSTLETDVCVWRYAPLVVHATQEEEEEVHGEIIYILRYCSCNLCKHQALTTV